MQIISFLSHYQLVYISFDISSFSLISYERKGWFLACKSMVFALQKYGFWRAKRGFLMDKNRVLHF